MARQCGVTQIDSTESAGRQLRHWGHNPVARQDPNAARLRTAGADASAPAHAGNAADDDLRPGQQHQF